MLGTYKIEIYIFSKFIVTVLLIQFFNKIKNLEKTYWYLKWKFKIKQFNGFQIQNQQLSINTELSHLLKELYTLPQLHHSKLCSWILKFWKNETTSFWKKLWWCEHNLLFIIANHWTQNFQFKLIAFISSIIEYALWYLTSNLEKYR